MLGPIGAIRVQRSAQTARVARKAKTSTGPVAFDGTEAWARRLSGPDEDQDETGAFTGSGRKVSPAVLAALLKLKRGG